MGRVLFGRQVIYTDVRAITADNVVSVLQKALAVHEKNRDEISYLYRYYKGGQPILEKEKDVRPEINNKIVENRANEIVHFKVGHLFGEPIQYVSRKKDERVLDAIMMLNSYMYDEDMDAKNQELATWMEICGQGFRFTMPGQGDGTPFHAYTLDPRHTFVVRSVSVGNPVVMGVTYITRDLDGVTDTTYSCYTENAYYEVHGVLLPNRQEVWGVDPEMSRAQILGIPITEYPLNRERQGAFEIVLPLLDAINATDSDRLDALDQFVQAIMLFHNVDITSDDFENLKAQGALKYKDIDASLKGDVSYLIAELNQTQTQTLVEHYYDTILTICGMPNRNGGSSTSDTGSAVIMRDGWSAAESRAKNTEVIFKKSEKEFLRLVLKLCDLDLELSDVDIQFTRRNYENITEKANVLVAMLNNTKVHPLLAFEHCGMFSDPASAYEMSMQYAEEVASEAADEEGTDSTGGGSDQRDTGEGEHSGSETA